MIGAVILVVLAVGLLGRRETTTILRTESDGLALRRLGSVRLVEEPGHRLTLTLGWNTRAWRALDDAGWVIARKARLAPQ